MVGIERSCVDSTKKGGRRVRQEDQLHCFSGCRLFDSLSVYLSNGEMVRIRRLRPIGIAGDGSHTEHHYARTKPRSLSSRHL